MKNQGIYGSIRLNKAKYLAKYQELYNLGLDDSKIARELHVSYVTTRDWRIKLNLPKIFKYKRSFDETEFKKLYNQGLNFSQIAKILGVSNSVTQEYGSSHGMKARPKFFQDKPLNATEFQIFLGTVLGDAYLGKSKTMNSAFCSFNHSLKQQNYCLWKYEQLKRFCPRGPVFLDIYDKRTKKVYYQVSVKTKVTPAFGIYYDSFYKNHKKYINEQLFSKIEALGLAVWFMDDGCKTNSSYSLATNCFSDDDLEIITRVLKQKFNLVFTICKSHILYLHTASKETFENLIIPYIHKDCFYKMHNGIPKTPLNRVNPKQDVPVLNPLETEEKAKRLTVMPNDKDEAIKSDTKAGHCSDEI